MSSAVMERSVAFQLDPTAGELSAVKNTEGQKRRIKITSKEVGRCILTGELKGVHYGSYGDTGETAALIVFDFMFRFKKQPLFRYKSASIKVTFTSGRTATEIAESPDLEPVVKCAFPERVYGKAVMETKKWCYQFGPSVDTSSLLPVGVGFHASAGVETSVVRGQRMEIQGFSYSDKVHSQHNIALWTLSENPAEEKGIPHRFYCAAIVSHQNGEFQAEVEVKVSTGLKIVVDPRCWGLVASPWTKDDPIVFDPNVPRMLQDLIDVGNMDLSTLSEKQKRQLTPLPEEYESHWQLPVPTVASGPTVDTSSEGIITSE